MASFLPPRPLQQADEARLPGFDCGSEPLNRWLAHNDKTGGSRTYVVSTESGELAGYFCLAAHSVEHGDLKAKYRRNMPNPIRCHTNFRHPFNLSWSGKTCDIRRSSKTTS